MNGVRSGTITGGSGHTDGTYYNVKLLNANGSTWDGATADVTVSGGAVTAASVAEGGSGYGDGENLYFDSATIGGTNQAKLAIVTAGISTAIGNYVQLTGVGTATDAYYRVTAVPSTKSITVAKASGDAPQINQYALDLGPQVEVTSSSYSGGIETFTCAWAHGLLAGNAFTAKNSSDADLGQWIVASVTSPTVFAAKTTSLTSPKYIFKHGLASHNAGADNLGENIGVRNLQYYDHDELLLLSLIHI